MILQQFIDRRLGIKNLAADEGVGYLAVVAVVLQRTLAQTEQTANLLTGEVDLVSDGRTVSVDQNIYGLDSTDDITAQFFELAAVTGDDTSYILFGFYLVIFQKTANVLFPEYYFVADGRVRYDTARPIILQSTFGNTQSLANIIRSQPAAGRGFSRESLQCGHSFQQSLDMRLKIGIGARLDQNTVHNDIFMQV